MANFVDKSYFIGTINLPKSDLTVENLELFITQFEEDVLIKLLGYTLYKEVIENQNDEPYKSLIEGKEYEIEYNGETRKVKWNGLKNDDKVSLIAFYTYCYFMSNEVSSTQTTGEKKSITENSKEASVALKVMRANSNFEELYGYYGQNELIPSAYNYLTEHEDLFPNWEFTDMKNNYNSHDL